MELCAKAGFTNFDFGIRSRIGSSFVYADGYRERAREIAEYAKEHGYTFIQSHAPYAYDMYPDMEYYRELTKRTFEVAAILGAKNIVVHGRVPCSKDSDSPCAALNAAYEFYAPFAELAGKLGIGMAVENLFNFGKKHTFTADIEDQMALIDKLNSESVSACWDTGHAHVRYGDEDVDAMKRLGGLISCTHIHDNCVSKDLHLPPFLGDIKWKEVMAAFAEIGYSGALNFELKVAKVPPLAMDDYLKFVYRSGTELCGMLEEAAK